MPTSPQIDPIHIFYPNGGNQAVQVYVWDGVKPILWNGQVTFSGTISIGTVSGTLTNNNATPAANNFGVLPAIVSTTDLGYTSGRQALLRVDTTGALQVTGFVTNTVNSSITNTVTVTAKNSNGFSTTALTTTTKAVSTIAAVLTGYYIYNPNGSVAYLQVFDATTGAVTLGSTVPKQSYGIPATSAANIASKRVNFTTAISIAATTTMYGSTAPSTGLDVNMDYE